MDLQPQSKDPNRKVGNTIYSRNAQTSSSPVINEVGFHCSATIPFIYSPSLLHTQPLPTTYHTPTHPPHLPPYSPVGALLIGFHSLRAEEEGRRYSWSSGYTDPPGNQELFRLLPTCSGTFWQPACGVR